MYFLNLPNSPIYPWTPGQGGTLMGYNTRQLLTVLFSPNSNGLNMRPRPFECSIVPRSQEIRQTIESEGKLARQDLEQYRGESKYRMSTFYQRSKRAMELYGDGES